MNNEIKTEEQIREEVKTELEQENAIKEQAKKEAMEEIKKEEMNKYNAKSKRKSVFRFIYNTIITLVILFVIFETAIGLLDMKRINDDKEPIWYINSNEELVEDGKITTYNLGLYIIEKTEKFSEKRVVLKPFFMKSKK